MKLKTLKQMDAELRDVIAQFRVMLLCTPDLATKVGHVQQVADGLAKKKDSPNAEEMVLLSGFASIGIATMMCEMRRADEEPA